MAKPDNKGIYSFQDWLTWEGTWELINGKAYNTSSAPTSRHQFIVGELHFSLRTFLQNQKCYVFVAPFDVYFSENEQYDTPDHVVQPDLSVICSKDQIFKNGCHGAPSLIIEVLSPSTALKDFNEKFNLYQKYGVHEYWIVDPGNQTVHVYTLEDGSYQDRRLYTEDQRFNRSCSRNWRSLFSSCSGWNRIYMEILRRSASGVFFMSFSGSSYIKNDTQSPHSTYYL